MGGHRLLNYERMSYYRYITGVYKSFKPELNRTLRSSSVPRTVPELDTNRYSRGSSLPPSIRFQSQGFCKSATPFNDRANRARTVPPQVHSSYRVGRDVCYTVLDYKVLDYENRLAQDYEARNFLHIFNPNRVYPSDSFSAKYNYYDSNKHEADYLYPNSRDMLGSWKHYNLSGETLNYRNQRAQSPLISRELNRYFEPRKRSNFTGDISSCGSSDFRHYNYRRVPYFGGSDGYQYLVHYKPNGVRRL